MRAALALRDRGQQELGLGVLEHAIIRWPNSAGLHQTLGLLHKSLGQSGRAMQALAQASKLAPDDAKIAHALARVTLEAGLPASRLFLRARQLAPGDGGILLGLAAAMLAEGAATEGIAKLAEAVSSNPSWIEGHEALANLRWIVGDTSSLTRGYEMALEQQPANLALWLALMNRWLLVDRYDRIPDLLVSARRACGGHQQLDIVEAIFASETGRVGLADAHFERLCCLDDPALAVRHVRHLLRTGRVHQALERGLPQLSGAFANHIWPYIATSWRMLGDSRWRWLEGGENLIQTVQVLSPEEASRLADFLRPLHHNNEAPLGQSIRGGTQTDGPLFARVDPEIRSLRARIEKLVNNHVLDLGPLDPTHPVLKHKAGPIRFAGSWSVRLSGSGHHANHVHPQGWFSSAMYVALPSEQQAGEAPAGWLALGQPPAELGIDLPPSRIIQPRAGMLVLFPSILWHGTLPFRAGERLSVAFDIAHPAPPDSMAANGGDSRQIWPQIR